MLFTFSVDIYVNNPMVIRGYPLSVFHEKKIKKLISIKINKINRKNVFTHCLSFGLYYSRLQVNKDQAVYDLSTGNVLNLLIFCDQRQ